MQISNNGDLLISINGKTKLLSKEEIVRLYNQDIAITSKNNNINPKKVTNDIDNLILNKLSKIIKEKDNKDSLITDKYYINVDFSKDYPYFVSHTAKNKFNSETSGDTIVDEIREKFLERSKVGQAKYGTNLDRKDLSTIDWLNHAIEEQMDSILYLTKLKRELSNKKGYGL